MRIYKFILIVIFTLLVFSTIFILKKDYVECSADISIVNKDSIFNGNYLFIQNSSTSATIRIVGLVNIQNYTYHIDRNFRVVISKIGSDKNTLKLDVIEGSVKSADDLSSDNSIHTTSWALANKNDMYKISKIINFVRYDKNNVLIKSPDFSVMLCTIRKQ